MHAFRITALLLLLTPLAVLHAQVISLDGEWQFAVDSLSAFDSATVVSRAEWRPATVPLSWQAQFGDLRDYQGIAWYRKAVSIPAIATNQTIVLQCDALDYIAEAFVNGKSVGKHEGGYTPFEMDIRKAVRPGTNEILIRVVDPVSSGSGSEGVNYMNIPHGKQSWYVQTSGPWQSVRLAVVPNRRMRYVHITPHNNGSVKVELILTPQEGAANKSKERLDVRITDPAGKEVLHLARTIKGSEQEVALEGRIESPQLWSPDTPNLYSAQVTLNRNDVVTDRFGFRSMETRDGLLLLNGEPFYLIGALDQDFYPQTVYSTPSADFLRDEMVKAKKLGLNTLRCHIKVPDPRYLATADEVGLLVWYEIPNWDVFTMEAAERGEQTLHGMLARDWNHPSLAIISLINESWGIDLKQAKQRAWLKGAFDRAKQLAEGRLVVDNSACWGNFHLKTDINDYHTYYAIPENRRRFDETVADVASRPGWLFSPHGDAEQTGKEPLMISEFGNWGLPRIPSPPPWWLERKFGDAKVAFPLGYETRFRDFQYDRIFGTYDQLAEESQGAQFDALKYEIEQLRMTPGLQGYVITEFTDINWECNGLLDMWRNFKVSGGEIGQIQQQDVLAARPDRYTCYGGDTVTIRFWFSHYSASPLNGATVHWAVSSGERGNIPLPSIARASVKELGSVHINIPPVNEPHQLKIAYTVSDKNGKPLATNNSELFVYPRRERAPVDVVLHDPQHVMGGLASRLAEAGYGQRNPETKNQVLVTDQLDDLVIGRLREGGNVVCLVDTNTRLPQGFPVRLVDRQSDWYDGNWASNFNWIHADAPLFLPLRQRKRLGFEGAAVAPVKVIADIPGACFDDCLAGMFVGWLHLNSAYILQMHAGSGKLILCTLNVAPQVGSDAYATTLFDRLVSYAASEECLPRFEWTP